MGSMEGRLKKASFISRTILSPFIVSIDNFNSYTKIKAYNEELQILLANQLIENAHLKTHIRKSESYHFEFPMQDSTFIFADVVGLAGNLAAYNIVVNKGQKDGVENDYPVLSSKGVVGKVVQTYYDFSVVMPMTNPEFKMPILDQSSNIQGMLESNISGQTYISFVYLGANISIGDTIVTSNLSRLFPPNYPVGIVSSIEESQDALYIKGRVAPTTVFSNLENVFILKPERKESYEEFIESSNKSR